jgi:hypothetical protein
VYGNAQVYGNARVSKTPINIIGLAYPVTITETHLFAGCQGHLFESWRGFTEEQIREMDMDGEKAVMFYPSLIGMMDFFVGVGK